jgi:hypothetical protein
VRAERRELERELSAGTLLRKPGPALFPGGTRSGWAAVDWDFEDFELGPDVNTAGSGHAAITATSDGIRLGKTMPPPG